VLEHLPQPADFLSGLRQALGDRRTVLFFEVPNALYTFRDLGIWDIIYEHCSYFTPASLHAVFSAGGFEPLKISETYGGQFLCLEAVPAPADGSVPQVPAPDLAQLPMLVAAFANSYRKTVNDWNSKLTRYSAEGLRLALWGAGSKGITFLNTINDAACIGCIVDINPRKQGMFVPGVGTRIVGPEALRDYLPHRIVVMNALYAGEVKERLAALKVAAEIEVV
jgi:hypothetical protein